MSQEQTKNRIKKLIEKYERLDQERIRKYKEANTRKDFILPLFQALGWDVYNTKADEVIEEESVSGKSVDYAFKIDGITKFYLEAKAFNINLDEEKWADQAIWYAWHKSVPWAILTDFESIKVYNAEWDEPRAENSLFFEIKYQDYVKDFERLWWLSKEGFQKGVLDKEALKWGHKPKRVPVDKQLAADLIRWRDLLYKELEADNSSVSPQKISESVQIILDRLIFIRTTEDRNIEERILQGMVRTWEDLKRIKVGELIKELNQLFRQYDKSYNSKLFSFHSCENLTADDNIYAVIINELYKNQRGIRYNFAAINTDVFGSIYEQYLGYIQRGNGEEKDKKSKRKSQGIYYTPRYIVDYIVKNTLGEVLKEKSPEEIRDIRILDPACGSGSFLIKALEELITYWQARIGKNMKYGKGTHLGNLEKSFKMLKGQKGLASPFKMELLRNNIYGVDLDEEAIEIAQLNLLLKIMERRQLLPNLSHSLTCGNSLISGDEKELKKYFGKDWKNKKPFNWQEKFSEVFKQGGFGIIVGNPPYIDSEEMVKKDKDFRLYCSDFYESAKGNWDIFCIFIEKGLYLLKDGGYFGMIVPNKLLSADYAESIRTVMKRYSIISINDYSNIKVFGANVYPIVIVIQKIKPSQNHNITVNSYSNYEEQIKLTNTKKIKQAILEKYKKSWSFIFEYTKNTGFINRIMRNSKKLGEFCDIHGAATVDEAYRIKEIIENLTDNKEKRYLKFINTGTIDRYKSLWDYQKTQYIKSAYLKPIIKTKRLKKILPRRYKESIRSKIIIAGMVKQLECILDEGGEYLAGKSTVIIENKKINLKFILALLNSKLLTFIYKNIFKSLSLQGGYLRVGAPQIKELPIIIPPEREIKIISRIVDRIIKLNRELQKLHPIMDDKEYNEIKSEIKEIDKLIDQRVYELYGLTKKEIKIIENTQN
ncbi:MAG: hypothetical protein A3A94_03580 [Candidatus Portnoybacteria bacterium RIFCSPLOWO2_01_FULL_43_11]|uniref:site-specific DNA-methyltransferase (adenine-specific) n=4 Tax=Bacteria candidate phyla TaxID=1783234 RepID=A0A1G2FRV3_9BACT|nr:MAG: hypothetical protein A2713_01915 [candidate division WWE3 bacterium RIFCSPHIGHO2_01_FULL_35_17]OGZ37717.1 MAG: hypothetical protein A3E90_00535 [Candidatus Portnoybacteria bacterium RIFCSPHIGHO2_12_FULL_40_11]OGZ38431.1 MAG: hypothetical protein A3A94_03580 [Candidatus Portnoybacteria bacterium RIFCSPLOWO2_01_FULL_43_11]OGZ40815.1 MAG: hypothetical protein A3I20_02315 [Candidatus Portnoybacteria bacterium RIFCSPLOWO2_02_FULL_40_15]